MVKSSVCAMSAWKPRVFGRFTISISSTLRLTLCIPPQQISPSAASRSPYCSATSHDWRNVSAIFLVLPAGSFAHSDGLAAESIRTTPYLRMPRSFSFLAIAHALRTWVTKFLRSSSLPIADPPPVGGHTGATRDPTASPLLRILSARRFRSSSVESMLTCGSNRNRSTPSNVVPCDEALAVISSIVSRSIGGSAPGPPLPTSPGHIALWIAGYLCAIGYSRCGSRDPGCGIRDPSFGSRTTDSGSRILLFSKRLCVRVSGPEVLQENERIDVALVLDTDACLRRLRCDEHLVLGHLSVANHRRSGHG